MKLRLLAIVPVGLVVASCNQPDDPQRAAFEARFDREAVLVKTCPRDPRVASGPVAIAQRVYHFEDKLWYLDGNNYHRQVDASEETVCSALTIEE